MQNAESITSYRVSEFEDSVRSADGRRRRESAGTTCIMIEKMSDGSCPSCKFIGYGARSRSIVSGACVVIPGDGVFFKTFDKVFEGGEPVSWACDGYSGAYRG